MSKEIRKFRLQIKDKQKINMPVDSKILSVQEQFDIAVIWALVNPDMLDYEDVSIRMIGTDHDIEDEILDAQFIGTVQLHSGSLVSHVWKI